MLPRHGTGRQTAEYPGGAHNNDLYTCSGMATDFPYTPSTISRTKTFSQTKYRDGCHHPHRDGQRTEKTRRDLEYSCRR